MDSETKVWLVIVILLFVAIGVAMYDVDQKHKEELRRVPACCHRTGEAQ